MYRQLAEGPLDDIKRAALRSNIDNTIQVAFSWNCQFQELVLAARAKLAKMDRIRSKMDNILMRRGH
ncbi:hypothetical protein H4R19_000783 [Coemansia spiralis]|nr:hypothetical protein H4R19_000783 [Coemansia spiralis]